MCDHRQLRSPTPAGIIDHVTSLSDNLGELIENPEYSDITLVVENVPFSAQKVILAARSEYFRAMLYGGMKESQPGTTEVELKETSATAFRSLLKYIYTGKMNLLEVKHMIGYTWQPVVMVEEEPGENNGKNHRPPTHEKLLASFLTYPHWPNPRPKPMQTEEEHLLDILGMAHRYGFVELETAISDYLKAILNIKNVCLIYDLANIYNLTSLCQVCKEFMDRNASHILSNESFFGLSQNSVKDLISRDSFCAPEIDIFQAVREWAQHNQGQDPTPILEAVRLPLMTMPELLNVVRDTGLVSPDAILDAIKTQTESRDMDLKYRGFLVPEENIATTRYGAQVIRGEMKAALLDGDTQNYDLDRGFTRHPIDDDNGQGIVVRFEQPYIINTVVLLLWDKDTRSYSYYVEASMDDKDYERIVDNTKYMCRSWQKLHFPSRVVRYLKIVGTHNTVNRVFHLVHVEAFYTTKPFQLEQGLIVPTENVATIKKSACVIEGVSRSRNALINGDTRHYDWDSGYTCHQLGSGAIIVQLAQPYIIDSMRLLLWDCDDRSYSYYIEVSADQQSWHMVCDRRREECKSWQTVKFEKRPVAFIKIVGTHNTANEVFHCVHFEAPSEAQLTMGSHSSTNSPHLQPQGSSSGSVSGSHRSNPTTSTELFVNPDILPNLDVPDIERAELMSSDSET